LPLVRLKSRLFGDLLVSMPYFQHAGAIADHPLIEQKLMQHANQQADKLGIEHIEYRDDITRENMPVQSHKVNMVLALPEDSDNLWQSFSSKLRAQIRRPQRENPETLFGREELLNAFYAVYSRNMRDLGSPVHSKNFIANILRYFPDNSWLVVVKLKNRPVGAALLLADGDTMEIPLASTIRDVNHLSLNMLLYWNVLQFAIDKGVKYFDFGRSTRGANTYRFKQQWGAKPQALYWHYWLSEGSSLPGLNPDNPKFALIIYLWKRLPIKLSQWIGPHIVKNIP
ncbi:MAG: FemAB family PEP-CTERM system-associated protein, partial [Gammaproteobacteria bacterium]|nr:FemAB family PEP-CTERM system-associated protein [Gammaproteobacteria bacterium]